MPQWRLRLDAGKMLPLRIDASSPLEHVRKTVRDSDLEI
jgi:hypothetical protein